MRKEAGSIEDALMVGLFKSLAECLKRLPECDQKIFSLYLEGFSVDRISRLLGGTWTYDTVDRAVERIRRQVIGHLRVEMSDAFEA